MSGRFHIAHKTTYDFAEWVPSCALTAMLRPRPQPGMHCESHLVATIPPPRVRTSSEDRFGNPFEQLTIERRLRRLIVSASTIVELASDWPKSSAEGCPPPDPSMTIANGALLPDEEARAACRDYAAPALGGGRPPLEAVTELAQQIHRDMIYDTRLVDVGRPVTTLLRERRGMCQDYTRLAIAALRTYDIPVRWVVGYVLPGMRRHTAWRGSFPFLHAWFSVFLAERGWVDFDATFPTGEPVDLLTLAWGADEAEVGPLRGELATEVSRQRLGVEIAIERLAEE